MVFGFRVSSVITFALTKEGLHDNQDGRRLGARGPDLVLYFYRRGEDYSLKEDEGMTLRSKDIQILKFYP